MSKDDLPILNHSTFNNIVRYGYRLFSENPASTFRLPVLDLCRLHTELAGENGPSLNYHLSDDFAPEFRKLFNRATKEKKRTMLSSSFKYLPDHLQWQDVVDLFLHGVWFAYYKGVLDQLRSQVNKATFDGNKIINVLISEAASEEVSPTQDWSISTYLLCLFFENEGKIPTDGQRKIIKERFPSLTVPEKSIENKHRMLKESEYECKSENRNRITAFRKDYLHLLSYFESRNNQKAETQIQKALKKLAST